MLPEIQLQDITAGLSLTTSYFEACFYAAQYVILYDLVFYTGHRVMRKL